jgi:hypothetical protein
VSNTLSRSFLCLLHGYEFKSPVKVTINFAFLTDLAWFTTILLQHRQVPRPLPRQQRYAGFLAVSQRQWEIISRVWFREITKLLFKTEGVLYQSFMDETYANGDGTDNYCNSNLPISLMHYYGKAYVAPSCDTPTCWLHYFDGFSSELKPGLWFFSGDTCIPEKSVTARYFVCL